MRIRFDRRPFAPLLLSAAVVALPGGPSAAADGFATILTFSATDARSRFDVPIGRDVILQVARAVDANGQPFGWDLSAIDRRLANSPNFFYECLCGHGPRPHDLYAWHFAEAFFPPERILPIYGYPFEVRVRCADCSVAGRGATDTRFTAGTVDVAVRRLAAANHRQLRSEADRP